MITTLKRFLRETFPTAFSRAQRVKDRVRDELRLVGRLGVGGAMRLLRSRREVERVAGAAQSVRTFVLSASDAPGGVEGWLTARQVPFATGLHAVYLAPSALASAGLGLVAAEYPQGAGVKILRATAADGGRYVHGANMAALQDAVAYKAQGLATLGNALARAGIAPRIHDVCRVRLGTEEHFAFILEDAPGAVTTSEEFHRGRAAIDALLKAGDFTLVDPYGYDGVDFAPPDGNGNFRRSADGRVLYVDTQNFVFRDYSAFLARRAESWVDPSHFGGKSVLRGGKYLYQSVPGLAQPGKRDTAARERRYTELLTAAGVSLVDRVVFDIGGNIGRMSAFALQAGARWVHLWDMPATAAAAEEALLLTGFTRCSTSGGALVPDKDLPNDLPPHLRGIGRDAGVVFYLAIHHHVGWLQRLGDLPWKHLVFEGPESQTDAQLDAVIASLHAHVPVRVLARTQGADGDSLPRPALVLERMG